MNIDFNFATSSIFMSIILVIALITKTLSRIFSPRQRSSFPRSKKEAYIVYISNKLKGDDETGLLTRGRVNLKGILRVGLLRRSVLHKFPN